MLINPILVEDTDTYHNESKQTSILLSAADLVTSSTLHLFIIYMNF